jgi:hypothetical protein
VAPRIATVTTGSLLENVTEDHAQPGIAVNRIGSGEKIKDKVACSGKLLPKGNTAMRTLLALVGTIIFLVLGASAQDPQNTFCNFADDNQITIQYSPDVKEAPKNGRVWSPGVVLYVQTPLTLGNSTLELGAYSVHFVPDKKAWTIVVNKNVTSGAAYDASQDVARAPMEVGELPSTQKNLQLTFAHLAPKRCNLRVYYQKTGAFADFMEK